MAAMKVGPWAVLWVVLMDDPWDGQRDGQMAGMKVGPWAVLWVVLMDGQWESDLGQSSDST